MVDAPRPPPVLRPDAFRIVRNGGRVILFGIPARPVEIDVAEAMIFKNLSVLALNGRRNRGSGSERAQPGSGPQRIVSPMPGKIVRVLVKSGEAVRARQPLVVVEAMKMENELRALRDGTVVEIYAREGTSVDAGALLVVVG